MKKKNSLIPKPEEIRTPLAELQVMSNGADTIFFKVLKRWARRYTEQLKNRSFNLNETDPNFKVKHTRYVEQAVGMELLVRAVEGASKKLDELEEKK